MRPELAGVPMAVTGDPKQRTGIILARNELAKKCGVLTAETIWKARQKCPALVCVPPQHTKYREFSERCNEIYYRFTDLVEPFGIDESWLDVTGTVHLFGDGEEIAEKLRAAVREELGITISVGVSFNKVFAKLGSDYKKPDATTVISRETGKRLVFPLPVTDLLYVGRKSAAVLEKLGITTIGQLAKYDRGVLVAHLGQLGGTIHDYANGRDESAVLPYGNKREEKSISCGETFEVDIADYAVLYGRLLKLAENVGWRMRRGGVKAATLQVGIKDPQFKVIQRQRKLDVATNLTAEIAEIAMEIIRVNWREGRPIRAVTINASALVSEDLADEQISFFGDGGKRERAERLQRAVDEVNEKAGRDCLGFGVDSGQ